MSDTPDVASQRATEALERQREQHEPEDTDDIDDEGIGALVNNTGLDGDAASS